MHRHGYQWDVWGIIIAKSFGLWVGGLFTTFVCVGQGARLTYLFIFDRVFIFIAGTGNGDFGVWTFNYKGYRFIVTICVTRFARDSGFFG